MERRGLVVIARVVDLPNVTRARTRRYARNIAWFLPGLRSPFHCGEILLYLLWDMVYENNNNGLVCKHCVYVCIALYKFDVTNGKLNNKSASFSIFTRYRLLDSACNVVFT